jgi:hypothetical protein
MPTNTHEDELWESNLAKALLREVAHRQPIRRWYFDRNNPGRYERAGDRDLGRVLSTKNPKLKSALEVWWQHYAYHQFERLTFEQIRQQALRGPDPQHRRRTASSSER